MAITLNGLKSILRKFVPGTTGTPAVPGTGDAIGDANVGPALVALNYLAELTDGQLVIGTSGTSALADPTTGPTLTAGTGGTLAVGAYDAAYSYTNAYGETLTSSPTTITLTTGQTRIVVTAITPLPTFVTGANWYITDPGGVTLKLHSSNNGSTFNINSVSATTGTVPASNTTASNNHGEKGTLTAGTGITITNGPGSITVAASGGGDAASIAGVTVTGTAASGQTIIASSSSSAAWQTPSAAVDASDTVKGLTKLSLAPVSFTDPIAVGDNDSRNTNARTPVGTALTNGKIWVGNGSSVAAAVTPSGDATMSNAGVITNSKVNGVAISGTPSTGYVPTATSSTTATWQAAAGGGTTISSGTSFPGSPATDDLFIRTDTSPVSLNRYNGSSWDLIGDGVGLSGTLASAHILVGDGSNVAADVAVSGDVTLANTGAFAVTKVQGKAYSSAAPSGGDVNTWNNSTSQYEPMAPAGGSGGADATSFQGVNVSSAPPNNGDTQIYNSSTNQYEPGTVSGGGGGTFAGASVYHNTNQAAADLTVVHLAFNSERFDTDGFHDTSTNNNRLTIPTGKGGYYNISAGVSFDSNNSGIRALHIYKNGSTSIVNTQVGIATSTTTGLSISKNVQLADGDYLEVIVFQNSGGSLDVLYAGDNSPEFTLARLG